MHPISQPLIFKANFYDLDGNPITNIDVDAEVLSPTGASVETGTALVVGNHFEYVLDEAADYGSYECVFTTLDEAVPVCESDYIEVVPWLDYINASISSRMPASSYVEPPNTTQIQTAAGSALTAAGYTSVRAAKLDNLDAPVSDAATVAELPVPLDQSQTISAVQSGLTAQGYTTTRAGFLDVLNGLVNAIWDYTNRSFTSFATAVTLNIHQAIASTPQVNPHLLNLVYGDTYDFDDGRSLGWDFSALQCPLLVSDDVPRLRFVDTATNQVLMNITGTAIAGERRVYFEPTSVNTAIGANTSKLTLSFQLTITRGNGHVITLIPVSKGVVVIFPRVA